MYEEGQKAMERLVAFSVGVLLVGAGLAGFNDPGLWGLTWEGNLNWVRVATGTLGLAVAVLPFRVWAGFYLQFTGTLYLFFGILGGLIPGILLFEVGFELGENAFHVTLGLASMVLGFRKWPERALAPAVARVAGLLRAAEPSVTPLPETTAAEPVRSREEAPAYKSLVGKRTVHRSARRKSRRAA